jgi:hypothetical protein
MAQIQILNPNDQPTGKWRLINELRTCLVSNDYHILLMAVAFAKTGPFLELYLHLKREQFQIPLQTVELIENYA